MVENGSNGTDTFVRNLSAHMQVDINHIIADELVSNALFENHELRISEPDLCDPSVKQYSGYLDISKDKHLFFWYVASPNRFSWFFS